MLKDRSSPGADNTVAVDVQYEIYLLHREEPVRIVATFDLNPDHLSEDNLLEDFMHIASNHILQTIDVVREHRLIFSDSHYNKSFFLTDHVQGISILAPSEETLRNTMEG